MGNSSTSELDAINHILRTAGLGLRLATSTTNMHPQALAAQATLAEVNLDLQTPGWWYNTYTLKLSPTTNGDILVPDNAIAADPTNLNSKLVLRGNRFWNPDKASFVVSHSVETKIIELLPIKDMPSVATALLKHTAALQHYENKANSGSKTKTLERRVAVAQLAFDKEYLRVADTNAFNSPGARRMWSTGQQRNESAIQNTLGRG